ncbi:MAG: CoA transferase [Burkholderiales bacterium]|nr:CoA transferase [Burkholderiales bacterium]
MSVTLPLSGIRVLDLSRLLPGPVASLRLAQMGAEVIKIEQPGDGDYARAIGPIKNKVSQFFIAVNHDKSIVRLDLKADDGRNNFLKMVRDADVVLESFRPGVMDKLGLGWASLKEVNPKLVMCAISGYGADGPYAELAGHDLNYIAMSGMLQQNVGADGSPALPNLQIGDLLGGAQQAVQGILAALLAVKMGGAGCFVDISMTDGVLANNIMPRVAVNASGKAAPAGRDLLTGGVPCYNVYPTKDGRYLAVGALELKFWQGVCEVLQRPDLKRQHWMCGQEIGGAEASALKTELDHLFAQQTLAQWFERFAGVDCCVSPVLTMEEAMAHPLFAARNMLTLAQHETEGAYWQAASGIQFRP